MSEYDQFAHAFSQTRSKQSSWPEFDLLYPYIQKGDRILDVGCGNGRLRQWLGPEQGIGDGDYYGFDLSQPLLDVAKKRYPEDHFFRGDMAQKFSFGADMFDVITGIASFHHLTKKQDQNHCFDEFYRMLKPGGTLFLTTWMLPKKCFWPNVLRGRFKNWNVPFGPEKKPRTYRWVTKKELTRLCEKSGFEVQYAEYFQGRNLVVRAQKKTS